METNPPPKPAATPAAPTYQHIIEHAPSGRSRCKGCRRTIDKAALRVGFLFEGPYGPGFSWHHLTCAARRRPEELEAAYNDSAWNNAKVPPTGIPDLAKLLKSVAESESKKTERPTIPFAELDPSGRAKCKHCDQALVKGEVRVVLGRQIEFGNQTRVNPINVHAGCVLEALTADDCDTDPGSLAADLRANSASLSAEKLDQVLATIGDLPSDEDEA